MRSNHRRSFPNLLLILALLALPAVPRAAPASAARPSLNILPGWFSPPRAVDPFPSLSSEELSKIEPALLKQLLREKKPGVRFIVHLAAQADLSEATKVSTLTRREWVATALQATAEQTQADIRAFLAQEETAGRAADVQPFWIFNGMALTGGRETAFALAAWPDVAALRADHQRKLPDDLGSGDPARGMQVAPSSTEWNIERIRAPQVWDALGIDGTGVIVANLDSGVDWLHPALQSRYRGYDPHGVAHQHAGNWFDATGEGALYPVDGHGHGSHTMGTIAGSGGIGVAPGARWIAVRAFSSAGIGYDSWIHAAFQWLLAPEGNPALAPDVVNNSWGNDTGSDKAFQDDVRALGQAGILAVFSSGNNGPARGSVGSPASYPEALAVGATDIDDEIASFSGRGPSPWGEFKPEVSAPGINIRSALPGGVYGSKQGTSMAVPHVAGVLALMLQANTNLLITDATRILTTTAVALPAANAVPNNDYGWGRVDAYAAVMAVTARGILSGVVTRASDGTPISHAQISATPTEGGSMVQTTTDGQGRYALGLRPGQWDVTASAFGYESHRENRVELITGTSTVQDFALTTLPAGLLSGAVVEAGSGVPLSATVAVEGTPAWTATDPATGAYSLSLPVDVYTISARSIGHRVGWAAALPITVGQTTTHTFSLATAPTILLVDSGAWYYDSQTNYYQAALDDLNYLYDTHVIKRLPGDVPSATVLQPYDVVIWSAPNDAPGYIGASEAITSHLESGGSLILSGQDVGFWDGGGSGLTLANYFQNYLYARFIADNAKTRQVTGRSGDIFEGLDFSIEGSDGADNQRFPDVIAVDDTDYAAPVLDYQNNGSAGQRVGLCLPYRALYLSFGLESIDNATERREVLQRSIDWLTSPRQERGVELTPQTQSTQIARPGEAVTHVFRLRNTGEIPHLETYNVTLESARGWNYSLSGRTFPLSSCLTATLTLTVEIPSNASWDEAEILTLTARSGDPEISASTAVTTKTPAPILLVDDDRWYDQRDRYEAALEDSGYPYDVWDVQARQGESPPTGTLNLYPIVLWYTAYDWFSPLSAAEETRLMHYLDRGGRLFFSSQDYLYASGLTPLGQNDFGLAGYAEDLTTTVAIGIDGNPVGDHLGTFPLTYPFPNWSDALEPVLAEDATFKGEHGQVIGLSHDEGKHKTIFFGFPFEALGEEDRVTVMERVVGWLSWLGGSTFEVDKTLAAEGQSLAYTLSLRNDGLNDVAQVVVTNPLPPSLTLVPGSLLPAGASYANGAIQWQGSLAQDQEIAIQYQAQLATPMPVASLILNSARIHLVDHDLAFTRTARTRVNAPDLGASSYTVDRETARPGETLRYTVVLRNDGLADAPLAWLTNPLPDTTTYLTGSLTLQGDGVANESDGVVTWSGTLRRGQPVTLTYRTAITGYAGYEIVGRAWLSDGYDEVWEKVAVTAVPYFKAYLPLIFRDYRPSFWPLGTP